VSTQLTRLKIHAEVHSDELATRYWLRGLDMLAADTTAIAAEESILA
jgi:hypothetical protein